jgi:flagellar motor protein MotB
MRCSLQPARYDVGRTAWRQAQGVAPRNLVAEGHGQNQPLPLNDTPQGRDRNRKIDIVLRSK